MRLAQVFMLGPSILFTLCVGFLNLSTLVVNLPLCDQLFSRRAVMLQHRRQQTRVVNWWKILTQQLRRLPFGQLRLLITFPLALFSRKALADHCVKLGLSEFLLLWHLLLAVLGDLRLN